MDKLNYEIRKAIIRGIKETGDYIFAKSKTNLNRKNFKHSTGALKRSGYIRRDPEGFHIGYTAPYAGVIEHGVREDYIQNVRQHIVRNRTTGTSWTRKYHSRHVHRKTGKYFLDHAKWSAFYGGADSVAMKYITKQIAISLTKYGSVKEKK